MLSGKEAKLAWANGEKLRYITPNGWKDVDENTPLWAFDSYNFEVLVSTIIINGIEIPKPFEPKDGDRAWVLSNTDERGYNFCDGNYDIHCIYGAWRTEEEIKQVVAQLRKLKCTT